MVDQSLDLALRRLVNEFDQSAFVEALGPIFENSPWVAETAWTSRPFADIDELHGAMLAVVDARDERQKRDFLNAHPALAGRDAQAGEMTDESVGEQSSAGLDALSPDEMARMTDLNARYLDRHGFPFVIAVRGHTKHSIFAEFERRIGADTEAELNEALDQIRKISRGRLDRLIAADTHHTDKRNATDMTDHEEHVRQALEQAHIAEAAGDHPYGSVITGPKGTIVVRNQVETTQDVSAHAELVAVREAGRQWGLDLSDATLVTTFEPCAMCLGAIVNSGVRELVIAIQSAPGIEAPGSYSVENLLDLLGLRDEFTLTRGVLPDEVTAYDTALNA